MRPFTFLAMAFSAETRARLKALERTGLLDSPAEKDFDRLTRLTCHLLRVPVALVSLVAQNRQFFKSSQGLPEPWASMRQTPLSFSFCQHVVNRREPLIITDARNNPLVCDNLAVSELGVIGYLGIPLVTPDDYVIGSLCAIDNQPRVWSEADIDNLTDLAALTIKEIELRFRLDRLRQTEHALRQQTQKLEQTNQELEQFTRIASHDLSNPLNTIIGFSELLQRGYERQLDTKGKKLLNALIRNSQKMKVLLQDLLAYARSGHTSFEKIPVNLETVVADTLENLESKITENQAVIQYEQLPLVLGDSTYLRLLLQNLIENAIKYRRETSPHIRISASQDSKWCQLQVRDNGIGIEKKYLQSIFELFRRVDTAYRHAGSGIGLATSKRIIEQHGGKIWVESELGKGFELLLDLIEYDSDYNVRAEAANSLAKYGEDAIPYLVQLFQRDTNWLVRFSIFAALDSRQYPETILELSILDLRGEDPVVKETVVASLGQLAETPQESKALELLLLAAQSQQATIRALAAKVLRNFKTPKAEAALANLRRDSDYRVVAATLEGLV